MSSNDVREALENELSQEIVLKVMSHFKGREVDFQELTFKELQIGNIIKGCISNYWDREEEAISMLQRDIGKLKIALSDLVNLFEMWVSGILRDVGIKWEKEEDKPPSLLRAKKRLLEMK